MELTFVESNALGKVKAWECEFEVTADFNLHIEREKGGRILFYQKSQGAGGWAHIDDMGWQDGKPSIDYDFTALVYPKMIKIVSESEPTFASVATDGEVTEIKSQSKEIEVTANGTTVVEPDAGFAYLNKVSVKTNVEQSGGGGGSGSSMRYVKVTDNNSAWVNMLFYATLVAAEFEDGNSGIIPPSMTSIPTFTISVGKGMAFCWDAKLATSGQTMTLGESMEAFFAQYGFQPEYITEEEFYAL